MAGKKELQHCQQIANISKPPELFIYKFLRLTSGALAASGLDCDMNTDSAPTGVAIFEYKVPNGNVFNFSRINFGIIDTAIKGSSFGGVGGGLPSGSSFQIIGNGGSVVKDFSDGQMIQTNNDFTYMAGVDVQHAGGGDMLAVRFSIHKAGNAMELHAGQTIRWTNRDNLSGLSAFRAMIQGTLS